MESYKVELTEIVIHWYIRLHNWLTAKRDKRVLYKQFKSDLHLDKLQQENISFSLPKSYPINVNEIEYLYNVCDRILEQIHQDTYVKKQKAIDVETARLITDQSTYKERRVIEKKEVDRLRAKQNRPNMTDDDAIALESSISKAESALKNTDSTIAHCKDQIEQLALTKKANVKTWQKQVKNLEKVVEATIGRYVKNATRKIEKTYGFTNFTHDVKKYDTKQLEMIKGDY